MPLDTGLDDIGLQNIEASKANWRKDDGRYVGRLNGTLSVFAKSERGLEILSSHATESEQWIDLPCKEFELPTREEVLEMLRNCYKYVDADHGVCFSPTMATNELIARGWLRVKS